MTICTSKKKFRLAIARHEGKGQQGKEEEGSGEEGKETGKEKWEGKRRGREKGKV
jgi:hypothetical protein